MRRVLVLGLLSIALLGCAADDEIIVQVVSQAEVTTTTVADGGAEAGNGEPIEEAVFPPIAEGIERPAADKFVDLRGNAVVTIELKDNTFETRRFRVDPGTEIRFVNRGFNGHNVTPAAEGAFPEIDLPTPSTGPVALVLDAEGDYPFFCSFHGSALRGQTGYVIVGGG